MSTVLVIDDEPMLRDLLRIVLEQAGHRPVVAASVQDARPYVAEADLVILDLMLPDVSGFEFLEQIRDEPHPPVLVLSALTDRSSRERCIEAGAVAVLTKPFQAADLLAEVKRHIAAPGG